MGSGLVKASERAIQVRVTDEHSPVRPWRGSHASDHSSNQSVTTASCKAPLPSIRVDRPAGSPLHPQPHSVLACVQLRSIDQPPSQSDIPLLCKLSWAIALAVFDLRLLSLCRSWAGWPYVVGLADGEVFGIQQQSEHSLDLNGHVEL